MKYLLVYFLSFAFLFLWVSHSFSQSSSVQPKGEEIKQWTFHSLLNNNHIDSDSSYNLEIAINSPAVELNSEFRNDNATGQISFYKVQVSDFKGCKGFIASFGKKDLKANVLQENEADCPLIEENNKY